MVGWSIVGGHGPLAPSKGLGVDNILAADLVTAAGEAITVNATHHSDLWWALRGGGGSTWGVITSITLRAHRIPPGGFTVFSSSWYGTMCTTAGRTQLSTFATAYGQWAQGLNASFGGLAYFSAGKSTQVPQCGTYWNVMLSYVYQGNYTEALFNNTIDSLLSIVGNPQDSDMSSYSDFYQYVEQKDLEPIVAVPIMGPTASYVGGIPSVMVSREKVSSGQLMSYVVDRLNACRPPTNHCAREELYHDITGQIGSPQDQNVSVSDAFRSGMIHYVSGGSPGESSLNSLYQLGSGSYSSESSYSGDVTDIQRDTGVLSIAPAQKHS